jgi:hypothetical protein
MNEEKFSIVAFDPTGTLIGVSDRRFDSLSKKWIVAASEFLSDKGDNFKASWKGPLEHIETQMTLSEDVGIVSFYANGVLAVSIALLLGRNENIEESVLKMFVNSLRRTNLVQECAESDEPFKEIFSIAIRPLMMVVPWGDERISEQDDGLIQELALHLCGSFFMCSGT